MGNKGIIEKSADAWNAHDRAAYLAGYSTDCEFVTPTEVGKGHASVGKFWDDAEVIWPDSRVRITLLKEEGEFLFEEGVAEGTNTGPITMPDGTEVPATGNSVSFPFAAVLTVRDGLIVSARFYWDSAAVYGQLGLM